MIFDEDSGVKKPAATRPLDPMSVPDLKEYIRRLQEEIARVEAEIEKKERHKAAADSIFKSGG